MRLFAAQAAQHAVQMPFSCSRQCVAPGSGCSAAAWGYGGSQGPGGAPACAPPSSSTAATNTSCSPVSQRTYCLAGPKNAESARGRGREAGVLALGALVAAAACGRRGAEAAAQPGDGSGAGAGLPHDAAHTRAHQSGPA